MVDYDMIWQAKRKKCPWWFSGNTCRGLSKSNAYPLDPYDKCHLKSCPIRFWIVEFKANSYLQEFKWS